MSRIYTSADQLIGKTPLLELTHIGTGAEGKDSCEAGILQSGRIGEGSNCQGND